MPDTAASARSRRGEWSLVAGVLLAGAWALLEPQTALSTAAAAAHPTLARQIAAGVAIVGGTARGVELALVRRHPAAPRTATPARTEHGARGRRNWRPAGVLGLLVLPAAALPMLGMVATGILLIAGVALVLGARPWWRPWLVATAVVVPLWLVLTQFLGVYLPPWPGA